jgi:hypothetical protein
MGWVPQFFNYLSSEEGRLGLLTYTHRSLHFNPNRPYCKIYFIPWQDNWYLQRNNQLHGIQCNVGKCQLHMVTNHKIQVGRKMSHRSEVILGWNIILFLMWNNDLNKQKHFVCYWSVVNSELDIFCSCLLMFLEV